jgi:hypothetical protein
MPNRSSIISVSSSFSSSLRSESSESYEDQSVNESTKSSICTSSKVIYHREA